ncbi:5-methylcytosine-specific restriction endonuclease system specificity protein McrC [Mesobacillus persicus]|nr:5-methylcytosine-specific restriction endonuclease system specificity protein McrC [Mesobacillus persicus]
MINIKNIYYMLSYAYQSLNEGSYKKIQAEEFDHLHDLMAAILIQGSRSQIKRGLHRDYLSQEEVTSSLRGKIDVTSSVKQNTLVQRRMVCRFDQFSEDTLFNQILKTTMLLLIRCGDVKAENRKELRKLTLFLRNVDTLNPYTIQWSSLLYHRNNSTYKMLMNICELVIKGLLITTDTGDYKMKQYLDDQQMHRLYEKFLLGYFKKEYPQYSPSASYIDWDVDNGFSEFLPAMKTDITLTYGQRTLIIDAKYYGNTMQTNTMFNTKSINSANLYQMFTYVKNKDWNSSGMVSGAILYAKTDEEITPDNEYQISGNRFIVKTLDLGKDWAGIVRQLDGIAEVVEGIK